VLLEIALRRKSSFYNGKQKRGTPHQNILDYPRSAENLLREGAMGGPDSAMDVIGVLQRDDLDAHAARGNRSGWEYKYVQRKRKDGWTQGS
jgi:hypothetical protein